MTAPGWYPDPEGPPEWWRYWNGERWTDYRKKVYTGQLGTGRYLGLVLAVLAALFLLVMVLTALA